MYFFVLENKPIYLSFFLLLLRVVLWNYSAAACTLRAASACCCVRRGDRQQTVIAFIKHVFINNFHTPACAAQNETYVDDVVTHTYRSANMD